MNVPIVWITGGPSSGKTTLAQNIVQKYGYKHVDINAMVEHEIEAESEQGNQFAATVNDAQVVPLGDIILQVESDIMGNRSGVRGFVIDGYPQNQEDANLLEQRIGSPDLIIALDVGQETLETRRSAQGARPSITAHMYQLNMQAILEQYGSKTLQINGDRDAYAVFEEVIPNLEVLDRRGESHISMGP
ncbi:adenylate kinase isoenzyme 1-like [Drosophila novamexicana]|uniref:adenylate kinase isoenzyme 1-like n=1 Tax=Drosophila novamexicana TaxID=47314 RepID=UPI0011E5F50E|nr:adenylate kinase isoenzyme 1-like [Drosophila novamexicana]